MEIGILMCIPHHVALPGLSFADFQCFVAFVDTYLCLCGTAFSPKKAGQCVFGCKNLMLMYRENGWGIFVSFLSKAVLEIHYSDRQTYIKHVI